MQLSFFQLDDPVLENIREELTKIDINTLTPIEALMKLNAIKKMIEDKNKSLRNSEAFYYSNVILKS